MLRPISLISLVLALIGCGKPQPAENEKTPPPATEAKLPPRIEALSTKVAQLGVPLEWMEIPTAPGTFHQIQKTRDNQLLLTPNECFFPRLGLTAAGEGSIPDQGTLNGGKSFAHVTDWSKGDVVEWGIWLPRPTRLALRPRMSATDGIRFSLDGRELGRGEQEELIAEITEPGKHIIRATCIGEPVDGTQLQWVEIAGTEMSGAAVLRKRWRPAAAHTRFSTPAAAEGVRMWIMEMDAVPGNLDFYAPITTPFGYYGPSWNADGRVKSGMNFSLWSYGRGKKEPPIGELSHLLAIGNRDAKFSGFGHEGTGVKIRGWEPLKGRQGQRQAFALRAEPGKQFNTYYSYFYATDEKRWRLFGVGRQKPKRRPLEHLWVGSFVEVPGPPPRQRTGSGIRRMRYRGWVSKEGKTWHPLTTMGVGDVDKKTGLTYTDRGLDDDGWFYMQTGGWIYRQAPKEDIASDGHSNAVPSYLQPDALKPLLELPTAIKVTEARRTGSSIVLEYEVRGLGKKPKLRVYFGKTEGLTLAEKWKQQQDLPTPKEGGNRTEFTTGTTRPTYLRLLLQNDQGQFWTFETTVVH